MAEHRNNKWNNLLGSLNEGSNAWTRFYRLNRALIRKPLPSRPLKDASGNTIFDPKSKADLLADSLETQFRSPLGNVITDSLVHDKLTHQRTIPSTSTSFFSPAEVWNVIKSLPSRRAPGPDGISNCALKNCGRKTITYLCPIFNWCKRLNYFPLPWKHATVITIPKPGKDLSNPVNHRPISLLNTMSKVLEKLLLIRLKTHTSSKIRPDQHGFRTSHSTSTQLLRVIDGISLNLNLRKKTAEILLDVEKAFDKVWHDGLISKLIDLAVPNDLIAIISSFLTDRSFHIKIEGKNSTTRRILAGVPQGSCLAPHLFCLYINDMPAHPKCRTALFADDTLFYATSNSNDAATKLLQLQLNITEKWFHDWRITVNPLKTSAIMFSHRSTATSIQPKLKNISIEWSHSMKYLGVHVDKKLNFSKHVTTAINKAKSVKHSLYPLLSSPSLTINTKCFIYKTYIRPIATYASHIWASNLSASSWSKLERLQSTSLRQISDQPWFVNNKAIRHSTNILPIMDHINQLTNSVKTQIINSPHNHISEISTRRPTSQLFTKRPINF
ncbi:unnamed protein product [Macrosiphum euphorbiae]|uniref:Reverse transcriptase domain-containing protein n=1 Tax=Macrosiphum euphorbiae TaxID=13131 RepID=A0AAV0WM74_9HEMI|nr:unnamed protein product [Macrosiphum euphorbiae]